MDSLRDVEIFSAADASSSTECCSVTFCSDDDDSNLPKVTRTNQKKKSLHDLHCEVAEASVVAVDASASAIGRQISEAASSARLPSATRALALSTGFAKLAAWTRNAPASLSAFVLTLLADLMGVIGRPPHRFTRHSVDQATLLKVFWAMNLFLLFSALSIGFFVWAFVSGAEDIEVLETQVDEQPQSASVWKLALMLIIAFVSGSAMNATSALSHGLIRGL